jgi:hypothetical protein
MDFLDTVLVKAGQQISKEDYQHYLLPYESKPRLQKMRECNEPKP